MKEELWNNFKRTGKIEYYLRYKELLREDDTHGNKKNTRSYNR